MNNELSKAGIVSRKNLAAISDADIAFNTIRRKMVFSRVFILLAGIFGKRKSETDSNVIPSEKSELPVTAVKGMISAGGRTIPLPVPAGNLKKLWIRLWLKEDSDKFPAVKMIKTDSGWFIADDACSLVIYLLLKYNGAAAFRIELTEKKSGDSCKTYNFSGHDCRPENCCPEKQPAKKATSA